MQTNVYQFALYLNLVLHQIILNWHICLTDDTFGRKIFGSAQSFQLAVYPLLLSNTLHYVISFYHHVIMLTFHHTIHTSKKLGILGFKPRHFFWIFRQIFGWEPKTFYVFTVFWDSLVNFSKSCLNIAYILDKYTQISYFVSKYAILSQIH